jgi:hypothetical protein
MSTPNSTGPSRWLAPALLLICLLGILPYLPVLDYWPWSSDSLKWYSKSNLAYSGWLDWTFGHRHFVGYRPIAALSLTMNSAFGGPFPMMYRLTDLLFFMGTGIAIFGLWATLTRRVDAWGLLPTGLFFCHPIAQDVLPFLARRTYLLALFFSTVALICFGRFLNGGAARPRWILTSCVSLALALFSNEFAYVVIGFMVMMCCTTASKITLRTLAPVFPVIGVASISVGVRWYILGHFGGYQVPYFAKIRGGERVTTVGAEFWEVFQASLRYTFFPSSLSGDSHWVYGGLLGTVSVLAYYAWRGLVRPLQRWDRPSERLKLWLLIWLLGYSVLYGFSNTWFWRQAFPMVIPMALLVTIVARDTFDDFKADRSLVILNYIPQLVLLMSMLFYSPLLRGEIDTDFAQKRDRRNSALYDLIDASQALGPDQIVYLALPLTKKEISTIDFWARETHEGKPPRFYNLASATEKAALNIGESSARIDPETDLLHLHQKLDLNSNATQRLGLSRDQGLALSPTPTASWIFYLDNGNGKLVSVQGPAQLPKPTTGPAAPPPTGKKRNRIMKRKAAKQKRSQALENEAAAPSTEPPTAGDRGEAQASPTAPSTGAVPPPDQADELGE